MYFPVPCISHLYKDILFVHFKRHIRIPGLWTQVLDAGAWTLASGLWTLDSGRWTLDTGHLDAGPWALDAGPRTLDAGLWTLNAGLWTVDIKNLKILNCPNLW